MKTEEFKKKLQSIPNDKLLEMANKELDKLCKTGGNSFRMSVPPQIDDTDMIFVELIDRFKFIN